MTKQHFTQLAQHLATVRPNAREGERRRQWENDMTAVAQTCEAFNPRFERYRFFEFAHQYADQLEKLQEERQ